MKFSKRAICIFLALTLAFLTFGCSFNFTTAKIEDAIMTDTLDADGVPGAEVTSFSADAAVLYASAKLRNAPDNTQILVVWTYVTGDQLIDQVVIDSGDVSDRYIYSSLEPTEMMPEGEYKVEFFIDEREEPDATVLFSVTPAPTYIEDAHMTSYMDEGGVPADTITVLPTTGVWCVSAILRNADENTMIRFVWYDTGESIIDEYTFDPQGQTDIYIGGTLALTTVAPEGTYHVDMFIGNNSEPAASVSFTVTELATDTAEEDLGSFTTYVQQTGGYQVDYPSDWIMFEISDSYSIFVYPLDYEIVNEDDLNGAIIGVSQGAAYGYTISTALDQWILETEQEGNENYTYIQSSVETVNGRDMAMFTYSWSRDGYNLYTFDFLVVENTDLYVITFTATDDAVDILYPYLREIVLSFNLL